MSFGLTNHSSEVLCKVFWLFEKLMHPNSFKKCSVFFENHLHRNYFKMCYGMIFLIIFLMCFFLLFWQWREHDAWFRTKCSINIGEKEHIGAYASTPWSVDFSGGLYDTSLLVKYDHHVARHLWFAEVSKWHLLYIEEYF